MRALELAAEVENETGFSKLFLRGYGILSGFGTSVTRPIMSLLMLYFINAILAGVAGTHLNSASEKDAGWLLQIGGADCMSQLARSLLFPLQVIFNPFAAFSYELTVMPDRVFLVFVSFLSAIVSILLLFFLAVGIRRRFRDW